MAQLPCFAEGRGGPTASTWWPCRASHAASLPTPAPMSATREGAVGSKCITGANFCAVSTQA
jgi:hypothetical protein